MQKHYDIIAIGGGSGGLSAIKRANKYGKKCAIIEMQEIGGTCVNLGCVPKKVMWYAANTFATIKEAKGFGFKINNYSFSWDILKKARDEYIKNINNWYYQNLESTGINYIKGFAKLINKNTITVNKKEVTADNIVIATGSKPFIPNIDGSEFTITSDGFFDLEELPKNVAIIGGGFIAVELAGVMQNLGSSVSIIIRSEKLLNNFDSIIKEQIIKEYKKQKINIITNKNIKKIDNKGSIYFQDSTLTGFDTIIWATGRIPMSSNIGLEKLGVKTNNKGFIVTDNQQNTNIKGIYAVGDITGKATLTPVAIAQGEKLSDRLFKKLDPSPVDYNKIPSVVFSHPAIATIGFSEEKAKAKFNNIKVYNSNFIPMSDALIENKSQTSIKLICTGENEKIIGCHIIGKYADEIMQGFAVAIQIGVTKKQLDETIAIHPTSSEELVSMN